MSDKVYCTADGDYPKVDQYVEFETSETSKIARDYLAQAFQLGYERAKESIQNPQQGTILDVMEAFAEEFNKHNGDIVDIFEKSAKNQIELDELSIDAFFRYFTRG